MSLLDIRIDEHLPLSGIEQAFRYVYNNKINNIDVDINSPEMMSFFPEESEKRLEDYSAFMGIIAGMQEGESLLDYQFFSPGRNIAINKHPRYMPAISHQHDFFEIQYILSGQLVQTVDDVDVKLNPGDICFIAPNTTHCPTVMDDETVLVNLLVRAKTLSSTFARSLTEEDVISGFFLRILSGQTYQPLLLCRTDKDASIAHLIMEMLNEQDADDAYVDKLLRSMMEQLFILLLRNHMESFDIGKSLRKKDDTILSILRYVQKNYATVSLSELAENFNYTETHLSYLIRSYTGKSFSETVTELRMKYVTSRLLNGKDSIADIMMDAGYSDKTHFYRMFRKIYGMTPLQYRKNKTES